MEQQLSTLGCVRGAGFLGPFASRRLSMWSTVLEIRFSVLGPVCRLPEALLPRWRQTRDTPRDFPVSSLFRSSFHREFDEAQVNRMYGAHTQNGLGRRGASVIVAPRFRQLSAYWASFQKDPGVRDIHPMAGRFWGATWVDSVRWLKGAVALACGLG